jgi:hypothetical protein
MAGALRLGTILRYGGDQSTLVLQRIRLIPSAGKKECGGRSARHTCELACAAKDLVRAHGDGLF